VVITYHQIRQMTLKIAEQAEYVRELKDVLEQVQALSDKLSSVGDEIEEHRQEMTHDIRSVEILEDILRRQVFTDPEPPPNGPESAEAAPGRRMTVEPGPAQSAAETPSSRPYTQDVRLGSHDGIQFI
jgi:hypothetical protein